MPDKPALLEPSFAQAIAAIEQSADLSKSTKRHWVCSLRQIGKWLDRPFELIPARWTSIRLPVGQLHHARLDVTAKTVANHKSNAAAALRWFGKEHNVSPHGMVLSAEWAALRDGIGDRGRRARLYGLMRYCSGRGLEPTAVDDAVLREYLRYRAETTSLAASTTAQRSIAREWNKCADGSTDASLAALLDPDVVGPVLDAYWKKNGEEPKVYTIDLGWKLLGLAKQIGLGETAIERLDDIRASLEEHRHGGLTGKNLNLIRQVLTEGIWSEVVSLPNALMRQARADQAHAPVKAAVTAQLAVAIAILSVAPVRLTNLVSIELEKNLIKPGGPVSPFWLTFPHYDVKNRVNLDFTFNEALTKLIDEYIHDFRPTLVRGSNAAWLFPGVAGEPKTANMFSTQITERIQKATGVRVTVHQFRHACAAIFLKHRPGEYEVVRRLLGHRNIQTTINFYCGLETTQASETFGNIIRQHIKFDDAA